MSSSTFQKIDGIYQCNLILEDGTLYIIPMREDGYIHATKMAKIVKKQVSDWKRLSETKKIVLKLKSYNQENIKLIDVYKSGNCRLQGTWIHPDLGVNFAQWCSPEFSLQVSKWIRELLITGKVEIGQEKSESDIKQEYEERMREADKKLRDVELKLQESNGKLEQQDKIIMCQMNEANRNEQIIVRQTQDHQAFLRRKNLYKLNKGPSVYLVDMNGLNPEYIESGKFCPKIGYSADITNRCSGFRTSSPYMKMYFHLYSPKAAFLEASIKTFYEDQLEPNNREFITGVDKETLIAKILFYAEEFSKNEYTITSQEELDLYNSHIQPITESTFQNISSEDVDATPLTKRCGGTQGSHTTEESRHLPLTSYTLNKSNKGGYNRLCKECYLIKKYGADRKRRKVVEIPIFDFNTHKWCNLCETVKIKTSFYKDSAKPDGLNANCKACKYNQKKNSKAQKDEDKKVEISVLEDVQV